MSKNQHNRLYKVISTHQLFKIQFSPFSQIFFPRKFYRLNGSKLFLLVLWLSISDIRQFSKYSSNLEFYWNWNRCNLKTERLGNFFIHRRWKLSNLQFVMRRGCKEYNSVSITSLMCKFVINDCKLNFKG